MKDYPQLSIRVPGEVRARLQALSAIKARPQWRIITDAIDCYVRERPDRERKLILDMINGRAATGRARRR